MSSTYGSSSSSIDRARRLLGDTGADGGVFLLSDEEIEAELSVLTFNNAVATLADGLAVRFAQFPNETETPGGHSLKWGDRVSAWQKLSTRMRATPEAKRNPGAARLGLLTNPVESKLR